MSAIVVLTATIADGAEDVADELVAVLQEACDANYSGPGRLVTIREHPTSGSGLRTDVVKSAAWDAVAGVLTITAAAVRDAGE